MNSPQYRHRSHRRTADLVRRITCVVALATIALAWSGDIHGQPTAAAEKAEAGDMMTVFPQVTNISTVPTLNPGKGWAIYSWGRMPRGLSRGAIDNSSIVYLRTDWIVIENKGEGDFDWTMIDQHIQASKAMGKKLAFRIMGLDPHANTEYTFPKWVIDGHEDQFYQATINLEGRLKPRWFPKDPNTSERWKYACRHLAKALGERYNKHPDIAFVEVGTIGDWGEQISNYAPTNQMLNQMAWREHMSWYKDAFPDKPIISVTAGQHFLKYEWSDDHGFGRRTDGFCAPPVKEDNTDGIYQDGQMIRPSFLAKLPSFLEFPSSVDPRGAGRNFWWGTFWKGVIDYAKPSYLGSNFGGGVTTYLDGKYPYRLVESGNRTGYHLVVDRIRYAKGLAEGNSGKVSFIFRNDGCRYPDYPIHVAFVLLDKDGAVVRRAWCDSVDLRNNLRPWINYKKVDNHSGRFVLANPDRYLVTSDVTFTGDAVAGRPAIGFFTDRNLETPDIRLGNSGRDANGWYPLDQYPNEPQGERYPAMHNLAFLKPAITSDAEADKPLAAVDGNDSTIWTSPAKAGQSIIVDLEKTTAFSAIMLDWADASARAYTLEISDDGVAWKLLQKVEKSDGGIDYVKFDTLTARHVRLTGDDAQGLSLYAFEVLGSSEVEDPALDTPAINALFPETIGTQSPAAPKAE